MEKIVESGGNMNVQNDLGKTIFADLNRRFEVVSTEGFEEKPCDSDLILALRRAIDEVRRKIENFLGEIAASNGEMGFNVIEEAFPDAVQVISGGRRHGDAKKVSVEEVINAYASEPVRNFMVAFEQDQGISLLRQVEAEVVTVLDTEEIIVPPVSLERNIINNGGEADIDLSLKPRYELCKEVLKEIGLTTNDYIVHVGEVSEEMVRTEPYLQVVIPVLNRMVLICDQHKNRTFVVRGEGRLAELKYRKMDKEMLKNDCEVRTFVWTEKT